MNDDESGLIPLLQDAVKGLHQCDAIHRETVSVHEKFQGQTLWQGDVEIFDLKGHPKAKRCFAWLHREPGKCMRYMALLDQWPVTSPGAAVKAMIAMNIPVIPGSKPTNDFNS